MNYCLKVFLPTGSDMLVSLYATYRLGYFRGKWTEAPEGTLLFIYDRVEYRSVYNEELRCVENNVEKTIGEYVAGRQIWICECKEITRRQFCWERMHPQCRQDLNLLRLSFSQEFNKYDFFSFTPAVKPLIKLDLEPGLDSSVYIDALKEYVNANSSI
jgi:hypothetical protein